MGMMGRESSLSTGGDAGPTRGERFLDVACPYSPVFSIFFSIALLFALLSVVVLVNVDPSSDSFVIALLTIAVDGFIMVVTGTILYYCRRKRFA